MASEKKVSGIEALFLTKKGKVAMNYVYSFGAAVVILGALFKIMHWPGAEIALIGGMGTEVLIFIISGFEPQTVEAHYHWENVYPQLVAEASVAHPKTSGGSLTQQLDKLLEESKLEPELFDSLGKGLQSFSGQVAKLNDLTDAAAASNEFATNAKAASGSISNFASATVSATQSLSGLQSASVTLTETADDAVKFKEQLTTLNKNLASLNAVYGTLSVATLTETADDAVKFKEQLATLNKNLASLNSVYGNMLSAMRA